MKRRLAEERRGSLARTIKETREELKRGETRQGTVEDLMREISE